MSKTLLIFCVMTAPLFGDLVIMHAGDSIQANPASRLEMHDLFAAASIPIDFVGHNMSYTGMPDIDHQSWGSMRWGQIHNGWGMSGPASEKGLVDGIPDFMPDIVILGGGTNNVAQEPINSMMTAPLAELTALVDFVVAEGVPLLLATVPNVLATSSLADKQSNVLTINSLIQTNFGSRAGVTVVDLNAYMNTTADYHADGIHFSESGYEKLGQFWFDEIVASGVAVPEPSAFVMVGLVLSLLLPNCVQWRNRTAQPSTNTNT